MVILIGMTSSGKDLVSNILVAKYGYKKIVVYTTRPMRKNEIQNITYHFISEEEFKQRIDDDFFAEYKSYNTEFGIWYYGTALEDLINANDKSVIILTPQGYRDIKTKLNTINYTSIYLYADEVTLKNRLIKRGDNPKEAERRLQHDYEDFKGFENEVDHIIYNNNDTDINYVVERILEFVR